MNIKSSISSFFAFTNETVFQEICAISFTKKKASLQQPHVQKW